MNFYIHTFGCQMNDHDSATLAGLMVEAGHAEVSEAKDADLILLNTCAIREKAEQKVYSMLGRYKKLKAQKPDLIIGVGGCMAQGDGRKVFSRAPYVDLVFGTQTFHKVADMVRRVAEDRRRLTWIEMPHEMDDLEAFYSHSRAEGLKAYVTVMQGCDNYCAYCIVPYVRGHEVSRTSRDILSEVERLVAGGVREITLLGQNVNSYGLKGGDGADFADLIEKVAAVADLTRIRFTTNHPKDLSDKLIDLIAAEPKLMPHIHLPLQSGSDKVLGGMNRRYNVAHYLGLIDKLRGAVPDIAITSDLIVGFPGETEADFDATIEVMDKVAFDGLFSFKYSPRRGTKAASMDDALPEEVKEQRLVVLQKRQQVHTLARNREWIGRTCPVLVEGESKAGEGQLMGRTPQNRIVNFTGPATLVGTVVDVAVTDAFINSMVGELSTGER